MEPSAFVAPVVTVVIAVVSFYGMTSARLARIEQKVDDLADDVRRHNGVVERTGIAERDIKTAFTKYEDLRDEVKELRDEVHRLHSK